MESSSNAEFARKLTELLELQKQQEEQVRLAEQFSLKLKEQLEKADIKGDFQFKSVDEVVTTDLNSSYYSNETSNATSNEEETDELEKEPDKNTSNQNKEFNERLLSDIVEESFEQGLSTDAVHSKFSTPKEKDNLNSELNKEDKTNRNQNNQSEETKLKSLNKQYTKLCTEECTKQDCVHNIRHSETYELILKIISNYNSKNLNNSADETELKEVNGLDGIDDDDDDDEDDEEDEEEEDEYYEEKNEPDYKTELKNRFSNQNIYEINEFFKEELTKSLDPNLNNEQYVYRSLSETNLNYTLEQPLEQKKSKNENNLKPNDFRLKNRTFSSDAINNQLRSIEKDLVVEDAENCPIKPGIDGQHVRTFDELLSQQLNDYGNLSSMYVRPMNPTKRPYLRKGAGLKRFQSRSTSEPRGKLCRIRSQKIKKLTDEKKVQKKSNENKKVPDPKRIDYLAQPKFTINKEFGDLVDKENELKLSQSKLDSINRDYMTSNLSDKYAENYELKKTKKSVKKEVKEVKTNKDSKSRKQTTENNEQANKKPKVQLVSKISVNKTIQQDTRSFNGNDLVQREWDKKESVEDSNKRIEVLLEKFIELYETKNNTKADEEMRRNVINMLKDSLRIEGGSRSRNSRRPIQCKECGKNLEEESDSESSFCCNPIEADRTSSKFSNDPDTYLVAPKLGLQTVALRNKIENLQRRLANLQARCSLDEKKLDSKNQNCQSFTNDNREECTCSGKIDQLKEKLNFITNKLQSIEENVHSNKGNGLMNESTERGKIINHQIVLEDQDEEPKLNRRVKQVTKPKLMMTNENQNKQQFTNRSKMKVVERKIQTNTSNSKHQKETSSSPTDAIVERVMEGDSKVTKYRSGLKIVEKSDGTVEKICKNGYQEIFFSDDTIMRVLVDGTKIIDFPNGEREIRTSNYKRKEFIDGSILTIYEDGTRETRYMNGMIRVKDKYGNIIADSRIPQT